MFGRRERKTPLQREPITQLEDLRDDCIALYINSGMTQREIHAAGGPTPQTISKWLYKETKFPRLDTIRAFLLAVGYDLTPLPIKEVERLRASSQTVRLALDIDLKSKPRMPQKGHTSNAWKERRMRTEKS